MVSMGSSSGASRLDGFLAAPRRAIWTVALPMMAGMAVHSLYIVADTAFIGTLGTEALAAATLVAPLFFVMVALTMGVGTAVTALVAQAVGRGEAADGDLVAGASLTSGLLLGILLGAAGLGGGRWMLELLGARGNTAELAWSYFSVISLLVPAFFVSTVFRSVLTGEGDARTPTLVLMGSTVINVGLDALLILGLELGLRGAALATAAAQLFSLSVFTALLLRRRQAFVRIRRSALWPTASVLWRVAGLAAPAAASMLAMSVGSMLNNRLLMSFGEIAVAAYGAASKVDLIVAMPIFGLAGSAVAVVGMFAGAGRVDLVRSITLYTYRWALLLAVGIGAAAYLASGIIIRIFTVDPQAIAIGQTYLGFMIFAYPLMAIGMTSGRLLQGLGHGLPALAITTVRVLVVGVPVAYVAVYLLDAPVEAVWGGMLAGGACATAMAALWVRRLMWQADPTARALASGHAGAA